MKLYNKIKVLTLASAGALFMLAACNKVPDNPTPLTGTVAGSGAALGDAVNAIPTDSLYYKIMLKSGLLPTINNKTTFYTLFVPDNNAVKGLINALSSGAVPLTAPDATFVAFINANVSQTTAAGLVGYNTLPQVLRSTSFPTNFPNLQYPSIVNPAPTLSTLLRLTTFPSHRNGYWLNNIPVTGLDAPAANGVIHHTAAVAAPPTQYLWDRISTDLDMTYMKAAILRADSGAVTPGPLQSALMNIGANFTVFVPTDAAFKATLTGQITQGLVAQGVPLATAQAQAAFLASTTGVFTNPLLYGSLTATVVKGIIVYQIFDNGEILPVGSRVLRPGRAFTVNFPTTPTAYPTLLNSAVAVHPGVTLSATFGSTGVTAATVKGLANATASNLLINPTPAPNGTSDQHYLNGVIHKIDQVLIPQ